jgi:2-oxoisovalerate dehydrogenase E1 component alpha subunit
MKTTAKANGLHKSPKTPPRPAGTSAKSKAAAFVPAKKLAIKAATKKVEASGVKDTLKKTTTQLKLDKKLLVAMHDHMVKARVLEERLIRMYKQSDGYFWIGGPGEEAFSIPLAMQIKAGQGLDHDFLHLHYRSASIGVTLGIEPVGFIRQMKNTASDPFSGGRNFGNHFSKRDLNIVPISSTIETQYQTAIGTGIAQKRHGGTGITIVNGGDAGTAEGDFASCLVWATRPGNELPILIIVTNNQWGISTPANTQHGERHIADRGKAFNMKTMLINGNDVQESWAGVKEAMEYIRKERKPVLLEARVSRLYGHSSATGCNYISEETDCLTEFESQLEGNGILTRAQLDEIREKYNQEFLALSQQVKQEPLPDGDTIYDFTYWQQKGKYF